MLAIALYNLKGGVGKSTVCIHLAWLAAQSGFRTLLWDLDPQGTATDFLQVETDRNPACLLHTPQRLNDLLHPTPWEGLSCIPAKLKNRKLAARLKDLKSTRRGFRKVLASLKKDFDYLFLDCPPALDNLAETVLQDAHFVLVPLTPSEFSLGTFRRLRRFIQGKKYDARKVLPFFNLVDRRRMNHRRLVEKFKEEEQRLLHTALPYAAEIEATALERRPVTLSARGRTGDLALRSLWQEVRRLRKLKKPEFSPFRS